MFRVGLVFGALAAPAVWLSFLPCVALAESPEKPDTGIIHDEVFRPEFDAICGVGKKLSEGCQAIKKREIVDASEFPWSAIGRVNFSSVQIGQHCTGTLVSDRLVLTAAHCVYNFPRKSWIPAGSIYFAAGYQRGEAVASSKVSRVFVDKALDTSSRNFSASTSQDWALLQLEEPLGQHVGVIPIVPSSPEETKDRTFVLAGYAGLRPHVLSVAHDCGELRFDAKQRLFWNTCSAMRGDSGAPVLSMRENQVGVVGVFSSVYATPYGVVSITIPATNFSDVMSEAMN